MMPKQCFKKMKNDIINLTTQALADEYGFDYEEAIEILNNKFRIELKYESNVNIKMENSITHSEIINTETIVTPNMSGNLIINESTNVEDTNVSLEQEHNKEKIVTKNLFKELIEKLHDCKLLVNKDETIKIADEILHGYNFEHSQETVLQKMKVTELKSLLRDKGMKISGNKAELVKRLIAGPNAESERKSCEAPFSELLLALALCNPNAASYTDDKKFQQQCIITDVLKEQYKEDMKTKEKDFLDEYFDKCKQISHKFRNESNITETDKIEVFVQGKCITNQIILELTQSIKERTQKKADLYIRVNGKRWIGISVKTTPGDPKSNWSIELLIGKQDPELKKNIKNTREDLNKENGIGRDWRKNKHYNRKKYNNIMYGHNVYKKQIDDWVMKPENKSNMQNIIAKAAGSSNHFEMYECNGCEYRDLNRIHDEIKNASEFTILPDIPENSKYIEETFKQKTHYSNTAAKMWYYIILNNTVKYRIEIRWKGEPYASPQLLLFDV